ncbi:acid-sensing ion channel 1C-like isoform X2 [Amphiura filiformis]|uniref:acid-sensing ion channel 1C-like isoform X2 n=1 Tax=Amphiura filiformis TaxID=82378 RepID=UPI003B21C5D3
MVYFREYACEVSDFHGIKHIAGKGGLLRRLFWLLCFLSALGVFLWQTVLLFFFYFEDHHITKVDVSYESSLVFPAVTVCNFNKYRESALTEDDIKNVGIHLGIIDEDHNLIYPTLYTEEFQNKIASVNWTGVEEDDNYNMTDFQLRTGHQIDDMIIECTWRGEECEDEYFTHIFTHLGNCYTFNKYSSDSDLLTSPAAGPANGLKLMLDIETEEYVPSNDLDGGASDSGVMVMVHDATEPPYVKEFAMPVGPGFHTFISMRHESITALPSPYTDCETDGDIEYYDHYSLQACRIECETNIVVEACGCKLIEQPGTEPNCNPNTTHECAHPQLVDAIHGVSEFGSCNCGSPCKAEVYPITMASTKLRSAYLEKIFQEKTSFDHNASYIDYRWRKHGSLYRSRTADIDTTFGILSR